MSRGQVAAKVAANKARHPELYCPAPKCLWRTGGGWCPRHQTENSGNGFCSAMAPARRGQEQLREAIETKEVLN